jgi:hypothetical protein
MKRFLVRPLGQILLDLLVVSTVLVAGCSDDSGTVNAKDRLCGGQSGFAARITGMSPAVDMCVSDQATIADFVADPGGDKYHITAIFTSDSLTVEVQFSFFVQPSFPTSLTLTTNQAQADSDPGSAWIFYRETKLDTYDYVASSASGSLTVTFNDPSVVVATFSGMGLELDDSSSGDPAGSRTVSEGYVSVTGE